MIIPEKALKLTCRRHNIRIQYSDMKKINKIIIWVLAVFIVLFVCASILVMLFGRKIVEGQIEQNLKMRASLSGISLSMPFSVHLSNLKIGDLFSAEKISATPSIPALLAGKVVLSGLTLINPVINIEQSSDGSLNLPKFEQNGKQPPFYLTGLVIKNGKIKFSDKKIIPEGFEFAVDKINARVSKVMFPVLSLNTKFKVSAVFSSPEGKILGSANTDGWIDFGPKNMDALFQLKDLDVTYFQPYFGDFISGKKLLSAKVNFTSDLTSRDNNLTIASNFRISNLSYAQEAPKETEGPPKEGEAPQETKIEDIDIVGNTMDLFTDKNGNLNLDFSINTKMDNPTISIAELKKKILQSALKNLATQNPETLFEKVNKNIEQFKDIGKEFQKIFKNK